MDDNLDRLIEPTQLESLRQDPELLILDLCSDAQYSQGHIPGAVHVSPSELTDGRPPAPGRLPDQARLDDLATRLGLTPHRPVVVYDDEGGGWAGRMIWTLDVLGHDNWYYLNGGLIAWAREGYPMDSQPEEPVANPQTVSVRRGPIAEADDILASLEEPDFAVWDARSRPEFEGSRATANRNGHIPGAIHGEWTSLMDPQRHYRLRTDLKEYLESLGLTPDKNIVTHCQSHHRSGLTYLAARLLGYPRIRGYHGSWSEWGNRADTPVESGP